MQRNVDVSFRIKGSKGAGTLYFTSIRREKGSPFTILRFKDCRRQSSSRNQVKRVIIQLSSLPFV
ncbi:hypothetical protein K435DRAFT_726936 [Dendrothele bispora CBS 962.96]|uniref:Uncharacterized protein n=1 Tax=Dendrothele bispora (strain CBS 962.96) TaxID=1314807 RepID=A0A4S8LR41_DENBC|nr:hypothetical protein K435DRAFT_726936 [Dendrothele bispora CBS 962.96]